MAQELTTKLQYNDQCSPGTQQAWKNLRISGENKMELTLNWASKTVIKK